MPAAKIKAFTGAFFGFKNLFGRFSGVYRPYGLLPCPQAGCWELNGDTQGICLAFNDAAVTIRCLP